MLIYVIVLIPEWIIFSSAVGTKLKIEDALWLPGFGIGILLLIHCLLYLSFIDADKYLFWVFGIFILLFFLIIYKAYLGILILTFSVAFILFAISYFRYEKIEGN
jgi:hypothetical protein